MDDGRVGAGHVYTGGGRSACPDVCATAPSRGARRGCTRSGGGSKLACEQAVKTLLLLERGSNDEARSFALADDLPTDLKG